MKRRLGAAVLRDVILFWCQAILETLRSGLSKSLMGRLILGFLSLFHQAPRNMAVAVRMLHEKILMVFLSPVEGGQRLHFKLQRL